MKIKDVDIIPIFPRLADRYVDRKVDMYGFEHRIVFRIETDDGLVGYGDQRVRPHYEIDRSVVDPLIGCNPFDFLNNSRAWDAAINTALYDLMGKYLDVPAWRLMGDKKRDWVPVAAWTRPASPEHFRSEIQRATAQGYRIFKMHSCPYFDVIEQTKAAEEVAPEGFRLHWDFNHNRSLGAVLPIVAELERHHPIVGWIEDPLVKSDLHGWRSLRQQTRIPIIMHGTPLGGMQELLHDLADVYMIGGPIGDLLATGFAFGKANVQVLLQYEAGTLGKAMAMHMAAVLPTHTAHAINTDDQYAEDITTATIPVVEGSSPVPEGPGLGYEVDEEALQRVAARKPVEIPRHVGILHLSDGTSYYSKGHLDPGRVTGVEEGTLRGVRSEIWEDDGSQAFEEVYARVERDGVVRAG